MSDRPHKLLFVISSMAVGGPQKSLIGLMQRLRDFDVDLLVLDPENEPLLSMVPKHVHVLEAPAVVVAATLPKNRIWHALGTLAFYSMRVRNPYLAFWPFFELLRAVVTRDGGQRVRQRLWKRIGGSLPQIHGDYDAAIGILGLSTYAVVDIVQNARFKYHWVRSDSRMLARDEAIESYYFAQLSGALAVSRTCAAVFEDMYPSMVGRTLVYKNDIPVGVASAKQGWRSCAEHAVRVLTVTRLDPLKGLEIAIEACALLRHEGVSIDWVVLGEGPERRSLEALIAANELHATFHLQGAVLDTATFLRDADVYVHPSRAEGRSNAVEEARAEGKAIVATRYATVGDQVEDGVDGIVCELSPAAVADAVRRLASDSVTRTRLGANAALRYRQEREDAPRIFAALASGDLWPEGALNERL